jgi:uncharacterized protein (TIGR02145 family)
LPELTGGYSDYNFPNNKWGYKLGTNDNYIPFVSGTKIAESSTTANGEITNLRIATKIDFDQPSGTYEIELNFVAVANYMPTYIQNLDPALCTTDPMTVVDIRDNEEYMVQRLADGNCWMLDNLRLEPTEISLETLKGNTNASDETLTYLKNGGGSGQYPANGVSSNWYSSSQERYDLPYIKTSYKDFTPPTYGNGSGKAGVYYNYCAASAGSYCYASGAGTGNAAYDICPAGWRLPVGGSTSDATNEFNNLYLAYGSNQASFKEALSTPLSGFIDTGSNTNMGAYGYYWSSTSYSTDAMYYLIVRAGSISPNSNFRRYDGLSIRCVLDAQPESTAIEYLQDVTTAMVDGLGIGDTITLKDKRDNEEYLVGKLADGNLWLLDNLRLDPTAVSLETLKGNTNATDEVLTYFKNGGGSEPYPASGVSSEWTSGGQDSYTLPYINTGYKDTVASATYGEGSGKIGVFYNFCAASAGSYCYTSSTGTSDASYDICPSSWRLPKGGTTSDSTNEFNNLYLAYNSDQTIFREALSVPLSGNFYGGSIYYGYGDFWSSTFNNVNSMRFLGVDASGVGSDSNGPRHIGFSIRCILK